MSLRTLLRKPATSGPQPLEVRVRGNVYRGTFKIDGGIVDVDMPTGVPLQDGGKSFGLAFGTIAEPGLREAIAAKKSGEVAKLVARHFVRDLSW